MMSALVRHKTAIYSGLAVVGAYAAYKAIRPATNTPELQRNRLVTTAKVVKEHVVAATDDVKKEIGEIGSVMRQHSKLAKEDVATAADEVKHAMKGDPVTTVRVRDTPPTARSYVDDNVREVPLVPQQQQQKSMSQRDASSAKSVNVDSGKSDYSLNSDTGKSPQHWSHPSGYEPQTFSESADERMHSTKFTTAPFRDTSTSPRGGGELVSKKDFSKLENKSQDSKPDASEVMSTHATLAKRDIKTAAGEVKQALSGDKLPSQVAVRDTPDLRAETPRDKIRHEGLEGSDRQDRNPSVGDRLTAAKNIVKQHAQAAKEDIKQAADELKRK